jgi:hypothetical protein
LRLIQCGHVVTFCVCHLTFTTLPRFACVALALVGNSGQTYSGGMPWLKVVQVCLHTPIAHVYPLNSPRGPAQFPTWTAQFPTCLIQWFHQSSPVLHFGIESAARSNMRSLSRSDVRVLAPFVVFCNPC